MILPQPKGRGLGIVNRGSFNIDIKNGQEKLPIDLPQIRKLSGFVLEFEKLHFRRQLELSITFVDDRKIKALNRKYHDEDRATDVLAFPIDVESPPQGPWILGEVVVSVETALAQSKALGTEAEEEIALYVVHGILHLLGYRDDKPSLKQKMWRRQGEILKKFKVSL